MTTPKDRLKPSTELVAQWSIESGEHEKALEYVCTKAAEWGAQQVRGVVVPIEVAEEMRYLAGFALPSAEPYSVSRERYMGFCAAIAAARKSTHVC